VVVKQEDPDHAAISCRLVHLGSRASGQQPAMRLDYRRRSTLEARFALH
jgi:hypothetical protein